MPPDARDAGVGDRELGAGSLDPRSQGVLVTHIEAGRLDAGTVGSAIVGNGSEANRVARSQMKRTARLGQPAGDGGANPTAGAGDQHRTWIPAWSPSRATLEALATVGPVNRAPGALQ